MMESMDTESIDISSLKRRMLRPEQPSQQGSNRSAIALQRVVVEEPEASNDNSNASHKRGPSLMHELESLLPSTVPESLDAVRYADPPSATAPAPKKMSTPGAADATQELSQAAMTTFLLRHTSRSVIREDRDETQCTLREGDAGYADLISSYIAGDEVHAAPDPESEPITYSPTQQTQKQISQYPESQRFLKTPATIGQKRDYNGNTKESPSLRRKPVLRSGSRDSTSNRMPLTQLFDDTQAATSPFVEETENLRSDRPSPTLELEQRPATATWSPPMQPIPSSEFRRAATEPASHYKPMKYSQAARERKQQEELLADLSDDACSDDGFVETRRHRTDRPRSQRVLKTPGSPTSSRPARAARSGLQRNARSNFSSPVPAYRNSMQPGGIPRAIHGTDDALTSPTRSVRDQGDESEAETEQEDEVAIERSSQRMYDPEDKENIEDHSIQIPQTTLRPVRISNQVPTDVQASPSVRPNSHTLPNSTGPIAVANSQPSQPLPVSQRQQPKSSSISGPDFVPQSQTASSQQQGLSNHSRRMPDSSKPPVPSPPDSQGDNEHTERDADEDVPDPLPKLGDHVTEDDDGYVEERLGQRELSMQTGSQKCTPSPKHRHVRHLQRASSKPSTVAATTAPKSQTGQITGDFTADVRGPQPVGQLPFETAATTLPPHSTIVESSPPIITPGPKRKRMSEIANQKTPSQQRWSQSFNAAEALDTGHDMMDFIDDESPFRPRKRPRPNGVSLEIAETATSALTRQAPINSPASTRGDPDELLQSQPAVWSIRSRHHLQKQNKLDSPKLAIQRKETWDVEVTPSPQKPSEPTHPVLHPMGRRTKKPTRSSCKQHSDAELERQPLAPEGEQPKQTQTPTTTPKKDISCEASLSMEPTGSVYDTASETFRTAPTGETIAPNVVFACFNGKTRAYFPARCLGQSNDGQRFTIQWEGYDPDEIDAYGVRRLELRVGDQVKVDMSGVPRVSHVIRGFKNQVSVQDLARTLTDQQGFSTLLIAPKQRKSLPADVSTENHREVPISAIYLDSNMWTQFKDREFSYKAPSEASDATGYATPAERSSTPTSPSSRNRRQNFNLNLPLAPLPSTLIFAGLAFAISYDNDTRRRELIQAIRGNGATILNESFAELFEPDSITLRSNFGASGFTALLADKHSRKPKYLQALALGLPCLSGKWIEACVETNSLLDWQKYLLPAGECDQLEGAIRSRILPPLDAAQAMLQQQLDQRLRIFDESHRVLVVMGRGKAEVRMNNYLFFVYAMGAASVQSASDARAAKAMLDASDQYDVVYIEERDLESTRLAWNTDTGRKGRKNKASPKWKVLGTESLVQSLILGELVD